MNSRLLFNLSKTQPNGESLYHGGGKYGIIVLKRLLQIAPNKIAIYYNPHKYVDQDLMESINEKKLTIYKSSDISIKNAALQESGILYNPIFDENLIGGKDIEIISTVHDIRNTIVVNDIYEDDLVGHKSWETRLLLKLRMKRLRYYLSQRKRKSDNKRYLKSIEKSKNRILTVSENSKYALLSKIPSLRESDIIVMYSPDTIAYDITIDNNNPYGKYYLLTSADRWMKNPIRAIQALDELFSERMDFEGKVVLTGINSVSEIKTRIHNIERFVFLGYVSNEELKTLYHNAYLFIYPSLYEGFGYPPLEAMYEGTPVIASGCSAITEICGDSVLYFNPYLKDEIKTRILQMENKDLREEMIRRGSDRQKMIAERQRRDLDKLCGYLLSFLN